MYSQKAAQPVQKKKKKNPTSLRAPQLQIFSIKKYSEKIKNEETGLMSTVEKHVKHTNALAEWRTRISQQLAVEW